MQVQQSQNRPAVLCDTISQEAILTELLAWCQLLGKQLCMKARLPLPSPSKLLRLTGRTSSRRPQCPVSR